MCVIICIEDGKYPSLETLNSAEKLNSHGGSIAWLNKDKTKSYLKGITAKKINSIIEKELKPNGIMTAIIHFRIASVGEVSKQLCHPFEVTNNVSLNLKGDKLKCSLLFHNGTWSDYAEALLEYFGTLTEATKVPKGEWSDTRVMAYLAHRLGHKKLNKITSGVNKIALLTSRGIVKYGSWVNHEGNQCSNDLFVDKPFSQGYLGFGHGFDWGTYGDYRSTYDATPFKYNPHYKQQTTLDLQDRFALSLGEMKIVDDLINDHYLTLHEIEESLDFGWTVYDILARVEEDDRFFDKQNAEDKAMRDAIDEANDIRGVLPD